MSDGPLSGLRVLDIGEHIAGPFGATLFADFGAEVIKVEAPGSGDRLRAIGPMYKGESLRWLVEARNKKSLALAIRHPQGRELLLRLVARSDVLFENYRPGVAEALSLGYEQLAEVNPGLVMVRVSGYGQTGPYRSRPAYDRNAVAVGGWQYVTGEPDGRPLRPGVAAADYLSGVFGFLGALLALWARSADPDHRGQVVDLALYEPLVRLYEANITNYSLTGTIRGRTGSRNPNAVPGDTFVTRDQGLITMSAVGEAVFVRLCTAIGRPELPSDPRFATNRVRMANAAAIYDIITPWFADRTMAECLEVLVGHDVPAVRVNSAKEIAEDEHFRARRSVLSLEQAGIGTISMQGVVPRLSRTPGAVKWLGPGLGAHTREILTKIAGLSDLEIDALPAGVVG